MKILDPSSAPLPLVELHRFLSTQKQHRKPDPKIGGYPVPNIRGYRSITKEFNAYLDGICPHVKELPSLETGWMERVIRCLSLPRRPDGPQSEKKGVDEDVQYGYGLTKGEVLMIVELGLGMKPPGGAGSAVDEVENEIMVEDGGEEEQEEEQGGQDGLAVEEQEASDTQVLRAVVEELDERLSEEEISEMLRRIRKIVVEAREMDRK